MMNTMLLGISLLRHTIIDGIILVISIGIVFVSIHLSAYYPDSQLFERSGSLVVLFSVIVEFRNLQLQQKINDKAAISSGGLAGILIPTKQPPMRQFLIFAAHALIIVGTIIWGYGGLLSI